VEREKAGDHALVDGLCDEAASGRGVEPEEHEAIEAAVIVSP
jgi:hypothetical protein